MSLPSSHGSHVDLKRARFYREMLLSEVVPFWLRVGVDHRYGGVSNVLDGAGRAINHEKYLWSQGRALWTFSALCRREGVRPEWRAFADHLYTYLSRHGRDEQGRWVYRLSAEGEVLDGAVNIYVDGYVLNGLREYYLMSGCEEALELALETAAQLKTRLQIPGEIKVHPFRLPAGARTFDIPMVHSHFFYELGKASGLEEYHTLGVAYAEEILNEFYSPEGDFIAQYIPNGEGSLSAEDQRLCTPGSVFEAMWFLMKIYTDRGEHARVLQCCALLQRHLELGWDTGHGGFCLTIDTRTGLPPPHLPRAECKAWWVHVEALVATALAYRLTGQPWALEWHERVAGWVLQRYPRADGEWTQWLGRDGGIEPSAALPVQDPFHLPRGLMEMIASFE